MSLAWRLLYVLALVFLALLVVEIALRVPFPCDIFFWAESTFMTNMLKLANGLPVYTAPADLNSFIYGPGLEYLTYALLAPLGLALDIRFCRLVNVLVGFAAAAFAAAVMTRVAAEVGVPRRRSYFFLAFAVAALTIFGNIVAALSPHPDNLQILHAMATLFLCQLALRRSSFVLAMTAMAVAGLGVMTKQSAALAFVGAGTALLLQRRWGRRRATALVLVGVAVGGTAIATLLVPDNARFFTFEVPRGQGIDLTKMAGLLDDFSHGTRLILTVLAPACAAHLLRRGGAAGRDFTVAWLALGIVEVAPNVLPYLKLMGVGNNLRVVDTWLLVLVWPALHHAIENRRPGDPLVPALGWVTLAWILLASFPMRLPPSEAEHQYCTVGGSSTPLAPTRGRGSASCFHGERHPSSATASRPCRSTVATRSSR